MENQAQPIREQVNPTVEVPDFKHRFLASTEPFLVDETDYYRLVTNNSDRRIYLHIKQYWHNYVSVPDLERHLAVIADLMRSDFTMLIDLTSLTVDSEGKIHAPAIPHRDVLLDAGLVKVADVVPYNCQELVHGVHSFSVNSVKSRQFHEVNRAENWLSSE